MNSDCELRLTNITDKFQICRKAFVALGDDTRQLIILALLENDYHGVRVGEIAKRTHLTRPSVSHHLQLLKDAGIVNMRREGTRNYYYIDPNESQWKTIKELIDLVYEGVQHVARNDARCDD